MSSKTLPPRFPNLKYSSSYVNPAIMLFGNRFYSDQTILEYLNEFLGIIFSEKKVKNYTFNTPFASLEILGSLKESKLSYNMPIKLNLKLFSFFTSSRIDSRHDSHEKHYRELIKKLTTNIKSNAEDKDQIVSQLEAVFKNLIGAGFNRNWCAKSFFPLSRNLLTRETIWNLTKAKNQDLRWIDTVLNLEDYYVWKKRNFMARGGELLYLQICNALLQDESIIQEFLLKNDLMPEKTKMEIYDSLQESFTKLYSSSIAPFGKLVDFIELLDDKTNKLSNEKAGLQQCEWCPQESWQEGYLFAIELERILHAALDPVDKLEMLATGCALQVLRSLCAQSVRYAQEIRKSGSGGALGYALIFSHPQASERRNKVASHRSVIAAQGLIQKAIRHNALKSEDKEPNYKEADTKYGHKLFLSLGKKLGIIVPLKGPGARFVLTDKVIRYLILATLEPGGKCAYDEFLRRIYAHFGIAVEGEQLYDAMLWIGLPGANLESNTSWFSEMLRAGGFLIELSDACSIVNNPFGKE